MNIYILPTEPIEPPKKIRAWPEHSVGFNIETAFLDYLRKSGMVTQNPNKVDWYYLPVMWSYWQLTNDYGRINRDKMQDYLDRFIVDDKKTFTVSEADNEPGFEIGETKVFSGNQTVGYHGHKWISVPIVTLPHQVPTVQPKKKYLSSFVGTIKPWKTRMDMLATLKDRSDVKIVESKKGETQFVQTILESYSTLCPRGSALGSYRFYESMQLGVVPIMISDEDFRPFPNKINWDSCSYFVNSVEKLPALLDSLDKHELLIIGENAKRAWSKLFDEWPLYVIDKLINL